MNSSTFLRRVLGLDSFSCATMGILLAAGAASFASLFGLPEALLRDAGLLLFPVAALLAWLASRETPPSALVWLIIVGNLAWTIESFVTLSMHAGVVTGLGTIFVVAQALAVLALALLEWIGLKRSRPQPVQG